MLKGFIKILYKHDGSFGLFYSSSHFLCFRLSVLPDCPGHASPKIPRNLQHLAATHQIPAAAGTGHAVWQQLQVDFPRLWNRNQVLPQAMKTHKLSHEKNNKHLLLAIESWDPQNIWVGFHLL